MEFKKRESFVLIQFIWGEFILLWNLRECEANTICKVVELFYLVWVLIEFGSLFSM